MSPSIYALVSSLHGHLAALGLAVLLHPILTLVRRKALSVWTLRTAWIAAAMIAAPYVLGAWLYKSYRPHVKVDLWQRGHPAMWAFETKEHLAVFALALVLGGTVVLQAAGRTPEGRRTAWALLLAGWLCGLVTAGIAIYVRVSAHPGW